MNMIFKLFSFAAPIVKTVRIMLSYLPSRLPIGVTEFGTWSASIISLTDLPDNDSMRFSLATMIMHNIGPTEAYKPKQYFVRALYKSAANEIAYFYMRDLKTKQDAKNVTPADAQP